MARTTGSFKKEKYNVLFRDEINYLLRTKLSDPGLRNVTITKVDVTTDLEVATVYWDSFDTAAKAEISKAIKRAAGALRSALAKRIDMRAVPHLKFVYDNQYEAESAITDILKDEAKKGSDLGE